LLFAFGFHRGLRKPNSLLHEDEESAFHGSHASGDEDEEKRMDEISSGETIRKRSKDLRKVEREVEQTMAGERFVSHG
jgi:hypothetical protein